MKSFWIVFTLLIVLNGAYAAEWELDLGSKEVGGSFSIESRKGDLYENRQGEGYTTFEFAPTYQIFLRPRFSMGGILILSSWGRSSSTRIDITLGPALTYYFGNRQDKYWPFVGSNFLIGARDEEAAKTTSIQLLGGVMFKLADHFAMKSNIFYNIDRKRDNGWNSSNEIPGNVFGIRFGFSGFPN